MIKQGIPAVERATGRLVLPTKFIPANEKRGAMWEVQPLGNRYSWWGALETELDPAPERKRGATFDMQNEIMPRVVGQMPWEAVKPRKLEEVLMSLTCSAGLVAAGDVGRFTYPGTNTERWARFWAMTRQGGGYTGRLLVLASNGSGGRYERPPHLGEAVIAAAEALAKAYTGTAAGMSMAQEELRVAVGRFHEAPKVWNRGMPTAWEVAICDHEVVSEGTQEQNNRGWHPAHCAKCGMDLSVDSGD